MMDCTKCGYKLFGQEALTAAAAGNRICFSCNRMQQLMQVDTEASAESPVIIDSPQVKHKDYKYQELAVGSKWRNLLDKGEVVEVVACTAFEVFFMVLTGPDSGRQDSQSVCKFSVNYELLPDNEMVVPYSNFDFGTADKTVACDFYAIDDDINTLTFGPLPMHLIGIAGPARAGKDTLADYLLDNLGDNWGRSSFADPMKAMLRVIRVDCTELAKDKVHDYFGVTPRRMMQTLGTEWGRDLIDKDFWVKVFARMNAGKSLIVPDVRFENEAELVRSNGILIHLTGRGGINSGHKSENPVGFKAGDIVIDNSRDLEWLYAQVDGNELLSEIAGEGWV